jgi:flagellar motor switch/type III secretory pathway protein FliN
MSAVELAQLTADEVVSACRENAGEIGGALSRTLDCQMTVTVGEGSAYTPQAAPPELGEAGLAIVLSVGAQALIVAVPEQGGVVPGWCAEPDATGTSRLDTLAQELGMLVVPGSITAEPMKTARVKNLAGALGRGGVTDQPRQVLLQLSLADGRQAKALVVWPLSNPAAVFGVAPPRPKPKLPLPPRPRPAPAPRPSVPSSPSRTRIASSRDLPHYSKSLLKIPLPVVVTLARKRQPVGRVVEIGPGLIIQFDKSCEEMLDLEVGGHRVACGEAVKVGDKFGLRITSMILPDERFKSLKTQQK